MEQDSTERSGPVFFLRETMKIRVRATPNARQSEIIGCEDGAAPVDGQASAALRSAGLESVFGTWIA